MSLIEPRHDIHKARGNMRLLRFTVLILSSLLSVVASLAADSARVIVFPLECQMDVESLAWLGEGIAISVSKQIRTSRVDPMGRNQRTWLIRQSGLPGNVPLSRASMIGIAQRASAGWIVMGAVAGTEDNLKITVKALDVRALKLSGDIVANGPLAALPQIENELAWLILYNTGLDEAVTRERFQTRTRKAPNSAYRQFVQSLGAVREKDRLQMLLEAVESHGDFPEAQFEIGRLHFQKGDCASAMPHLLFVPSQDGAFLEGEFIRGICSLRGNFPDMAVNAFLNLLSFCHSFEILNNLGVAYLREGEFNAARETLRESEKLAPTDATVSLNLALVLHMEGRDSEALKVLEEATSIHPGDGMLQFLAGSLMKAQGRDDGAEEAINNAKNLDIDVDSIEAHDPKEWARVFSSWDYAWTF
jgi:Flp pilus assembly protein TadD